MQNAYDKAEQIKDRLGRKLDSIRGDATLSPEGKRRQVAAAYLEARQQVDQLREAESKSRVDRVDRLRRQLFGLDGTPEAFSSYRDALDRARAVKTADEAAGLLRQAQTTGDSALSKAVGLTAVENGWSGVAARWAESMGGDGRRRLSELSEATAVLNDRGVKLADQAAFGISRPPELRLVNDATLGQVAEGREPQPVAPRNPVFGTFR